MTQRGWFVTRGAEPPCIHMGMLTLTHVPVVDDYLTDLAAADTDGSGGLSEEEFSAAAG